METTKTHQTNTHQSLTLNSESNGDLTMFKNDDGTIYCVSFMKSFNGTTKKNMKLYVGNEPLGKIQARLTPLLHEVDITTILDTIENIRKNPTLIGEALLTKYPEIKYVKLVGTNVCVNVNNNEVTVKSEYFFIA